MKIGDEHSAETKAKISQSRKVVWASKNKENKPEEENLMNTKCEYCEAIVAKETKLPPHKTMEEHAKLIRLQTPESFEERLDKILVSHNQYIDAVYQGKADLDNPPRTAHEIHKLFQSHLEEAVRKARIDERQAVYMELQGSLSDEDLKKAVAELQPHKEEE